MQLTLSQVEEYIKLAKRYKLSRFEIEGISLEFKEPVPRKKVPRGESQSTIPTYGGMPADDVMTFWSSDLQLEEKAKNG